MLERLKFWRKKQDPTLVFNAASLSADQRKTIQEGGTVIVPRSALEAMGDGKAEFLGEGTQQEFEAQEKADKGLKGIFGI